MNERPVSTTLLTAFALWALWLWARHRLGGAAIAPAGAPGPGGALPGFDERRSVPPLEIPPGLDIPRPDHLPVLPPTISGGPYR